MEEWKPIPDYEGIYEVSNQYRVRRLARDTEHGKGAYRRSLSERMLRTSRNNGYLVAYLGGNGTTGGSAKKFYIEAAVETLFGIKPVADPAGEWGDVPGYEGIYQVSRDGQVRSIGWYTTKAAGVINGGATKRRYIRPRVMTAGLSNSGYKKVELSAKGIIKTMMIHRLVAITFIPNPLGLPIVHHKDENKTNNRVENLEWVSAATNIGGWFDRRRIVVSTDTVAAIIEAAATGKSPAEILAALPRKRKKRHMGDG